MKLFSLVLVAAASLFTAAQAAASDVSFGWYSHYEPSYRQVDSRTVTVTTVYREQGSDYFGRGRDWYAPVFSTERVIVHRSRPQYAPFGVQRYERSREHYDDRRYERRHESHRSRSRDERGRRNHYK